MAFAHVLQSRDFVSQVQQQLLSLGGPGKFAQCSSLLFFSPYELR